MEFEFWLLEKSEQVGTLTINRPESMNALNDEVLKELSVLLDQIQVDSEIDVLILTGAGKAFVAGADIATMRNMTPRESEIFHDLGLGVLRKLELLEKPVIAAVNGFALGGGNELAMCADIRIASEKAKFGQPEVCIGISPGFTATQRLPRLVGAAKAKELLFTGEMIGATEAERIGLVNKVVAPEELMNEARAMAQKIAQNAQLAVGYVKKAINRGVDSDIDSGLELAKHLNCLCFATYDQKEGMSAFLEKRKPNFLKK